MAEAVCAFLLLCVAVAVYDWIVSALFSGGGESSSCDESSAAEEDEPLEEEEDFPEEDDDDDTLLAIALAHDLYELEKKRSHAVCSRCQNAQWSSDEDGNEYCDCPHIGWIYSWEADQERYCEHYDP